MFFFFTVTSFFRLKMSILANASPVARRHVCVVIVVMMLLLLISSITYNPGLALGLFASTQNIRVVRLASLLLSTTTSTKYVGAVAKSTDLAADKELVSTVKRHFNIITLDYSCNWIHVVEDPTLCMYGLHFAQRHGLAFRYHSVLWPVADQRLFSGQNVSIISRDDKVREIKKRTEYIAEHFGDNVTFYNVVNEVVCESGRYNFKTPLDGNLDEKRPWITTDSSRRCFFSKHYGTYLKRNTWASGNATTDLVDYIDVAFREMHKSLKARGVTRPKLCLNDYRFEAGFGAEGSPWAETNLMVDKAKGMYAILKTLKERYVPIDCLGFQSHFSAYFGRWTSSFRRSFRKTLRRFANLGVDIHVTELEAKCQINHHKEGIPPCSISEDVFMEEQAKIYGAVATVCFEEPSCTVYQTWGVTDKYTFCSHENQCAYKPFIFDENFAPKPAFFAIAHSLGDKN